MQTSSQGMKLAYLMTHIRHKSSSMNIDFKQISEYQRYKLMASLIVPRPIALITTVGAGGVVNAGPFSMFNMVGEEPPLIMVSINKRKNGSLKDTASNILDSHEFVVHLCDEHIAEPMDRCAAELPPEQSEIDLAGFTLAPSCFVRPPRIAEAPVAFECALHERMETDSRHVFFGRVLSLNARDDLVDTERWRVRLQNYHPVGRFGASFYTRCRDRFVIGEDTPQTRSTNIDEI